MMFATLLIGALALSSCGSIKSIADALAGLKRCEFRLSSVSDARLSGVTLADKRNLGDIKPLTEGLELLQAYRNKQLTLDCIVNVLVRNPNTGQEGTRRADARIKGLDFRLLIDDRVTVTGDILKPLTVPASGESVTMPIAIRIDLMNMFRDKGYDEVVKMLLSIAGAEGSAARLTLDIRPTVETPFGEMTYPDRIKVISKEFRN
ncbi:MAG: hypothetical protein ACKO9V_09520 [Candidatus Kapaibacterium sp.]